MLQQLVLIKPGDLVLDYSGFRITEENYPTLKETLGGPVGCVVRYIAPGIPRSKLVTPEEIATLHRLGIAVLLVFEWSATRANFGGTIGLSDGVFSKETCINLKYPSDPRLALIMAIDTNSTPVNIDKHQSYSIGFDRGFNEYSGMGIYSDSDMIAYCVINGITILNWLVGARSWGHILDYVHVEQVIKGSTASYDMNIVHRPFYAWLPHEEIEGEDVKHIILTHSEPRQFDGNLYSNSQVKWKLLENGSKRHLLGLEYGILTSDSFQEFSLTNAELDSIPDYSITPVGKSVGPTKVIFRGEGEMT